MASGLVPILLAVPPRNDTGVQAKIVYLRMEDPELGGPEVRPQQLPGVGTVDPSAPSLGPLAASPTPWRKDCVTAKNHHHHRHQNVVRVQSLASNFWHSS